MKLADLPAGYRFPPEPLTITAEEAAAYATAVGDTSPVYAPGPSQQVPPMALVAAGVATLVERLGLAGGSVHVSQEVSLARPVRPGEVLTQEIVVKSNSLRRRTPFATVETTFRDGSGREVAWSSSTIIVTER